MANTITTAEQLLEAGDIGRCELVKGELRTIMPPGARHGELAFRLGFQLGSFVLPQQLGTVYAAETGFLLARNPDTVRGPDIAFVSAGRAASPERGFYPGAPDLAVEVLSPDDRPGYVRDKVSEWLESGARLVWVVDPQERTVSVHTSKAEPRVPDETTTLDGGDLLPGFELPVREIFA